MSDDGGGEVEAPATADAADVTEAEASTSEKVVDSVVDTNDAADVKQQDEASDAPAEALDLQCRVLERMLEHCNELHRTTSDRLQKTQESCKVRFGKDAHMLAPPPLAKIFSKAGGRRPRSNRGASKQSQKAGQGGASVNGAAEEGQKPMASKKSSGGETEEDADAEAEDEEGEDEDAEGDDADAEDDGEEGDADADHDEQADEEEEEEHGEDAEQAGGEGEEDEDEEEEEDGEEDEEGDEEEEEDGEEDEEGDEADEADVQAQGAKRQKQPQPVVKEAAASASGLDAKQDGVTKDKDQPPADATAATNEPAAQAETGKEQQEASTAEAPPPAPPKPKADAGATTEEGEGQAEAKSEAEAKPKPKAKSKKKAQKNQEKAKAQKEEKQKAEAAERARSTERNNADKAKQDAAGGGGRRSPSPPPQQKPAPQPSPAGGAPAARAPGRPAAIEREGVSCVQTLQLGVAVRSAICIGKEVWTVDWKGQVSVRERDDASVVTSEIPTNRFIWSIVHMDPGLMWMGQEAQGISLFDTTKKSYKTCLTGGHSGGVTCIAADLDMGDVDVNDEGSLPRRRAWTGSNDFTIRTWWIDTWPAKGTPPETVQGNSGCTVVELASGWKVGISKGSQMHGHKNGVRALLRIGPTLWSGSDDGTIRLWCCADCTCNEVVEDAHKGSVIKLTIVRSFVWSAGSDGTIKEWNMGGEKRVCTRKVCPDGAEKGVYALVPLGYDVWVCGHHPNIQVFSQKGMEQTKHYKAHEPYVSNVLAVDRVETRVVWSTSLADKTLKVWKHTVRGNQPNIDELRAANRLYEEEEEARASRMEKIVNRNNSLQEELQAQNAEYQKQLMNVSEELAQSRARCDELEQRVKHLEDEWEGLRKIFAEAGLEHLLSDPEALRKFLGMKKLFDEAGLSQLLEDPELLKKFLQLKGVLERAGLNCLDPEGVETFLQRAKALQDAFKEAGLESLLDDPAALRSMLDFYKAIKDILEQYGYGDILKDPSLLAEILSRYDGLKKACEEMGFPDLFEDPYNMKGFLRNYGRIREEFRNVNLEYLLDSPPAMRDFLAAHAKGEDELKNLRETAQRLSDLEKLCAEQAAKLEEQAKTIASLQERLAKYEELGTVDEIRRWKADSTELAQLMRAQGDKDAELAHLRKLLEDKERERLEALEREKLMAMKYKELDIFKLDIIARELKGVDGDFALLGKQVKIMQTDFGKLRNYDEQQMVGNHGDKVLEQCYHIRSHVRDVINKCLSETQKMHIGVALNDPLAEGKLQEGGVMAGYVMEEVEVPDYGNSKAANLRHADEMKREERSRAGDAGGGRSGRSPSTGRGHT